MSKFVSWRDLLSDVISSVPERERMAKEMGVRSITLIRWATGESIPRQQNLQQLLLAFPSALHAEFLALLKEDAFSTFLSEREEVFPEISYAFGRKVLRTRANTPDNLIFWTLCRLILRQALKQLDPKGRGMSINVVRCMAPDRAGHVRTLLESIGLGTAPWRSDLEPKGVLLGSESLSGYATTVCRLQYIQDVRVNDGLLPVQYRSHAVSVAACPIMYAGRTAGCLALASTQPDYFSSEVVQELLYGYADLLALAFGPREFLSTRGHSTDAGAASGCSADVSRRFSAAGEYYSAHVCTYLPASDEYSGRTGGLAADRRRTARSTAGARIEPVEIRAEDAKPG